MNRYVLAPFSNMQSKLWGFSKYEKVANFLYSNYKLSPVIFCSKKDYEYAVKNDLFIDINCLYVAGSLNFKKIFNDIKQSIFYLGNDTGIMHVASLYDVPIFAIFSSRDVQGKWEPDSKDVYIYRTNPECSLCLLSICPYNNLCLENISTKDIIRDLKKFLKK